MISLTGLEDELAQLARNKQWVKSQDEGPQLAVSVREKNSDKPLIILFTTFEISKEEVNSSLKDCGYGKIIKIAEVKPVKQILRPASRGKSPVTENPKEWNGGNTPKKMSLDFKSKHARASL